MKRDEDGTPRTESGLIDQEQLHKDAVAAPRGNYERSILKMVDGVEQYAMAHKQQFGGEVGDDHYMSEALEEILSGIKALLNGELGRLSGGALDSRLRNFAKAAHLEYPQ